MTIGRQIHGGKSTPGGEQTEIERLAAAQSGDERAFEALTVPLQRELHVHCYRMLGSLDDADDALQETLLRAWRQLDRFEPRAPRGGLSTTGGLSTFRAWLYRIATNVCLTMLSRRARRSEVVSTVLVEARSAAGRKESEPMRPGVDFPLDPYPEHLLDELPPSAVGLEATIVERESVELAFVAAVQVLPPAQRATLLLRDVIGYTAAEVAAMLMTTVAGVNSALQRARASLERERTAGRVTWSHSRTDAATERALVRRLADAWHANDVPSIVALLTEDALLTMPPIPDRYVGREAIGAFLSTVPGGGRLDLFRLVPMRANRQPAVAAYRRDDLDGVYRAHGVIVLAIEGDAIASLVRFGDPQLLERFGLPTTFEVSADESNLGIE